MFTRREFFQITGLTLATSAARANTVPARRALIVGIDEYTRAKRSGAGGEASEAAAAQQERRIFDLDGAVNDATLICQILKDRFGFSAANVVLLTNQQATRARILHEFQAHLIDPTAPGDISFFYYAGHGSQVLNLGSDEADQKDETLVPADVYAGAADIRDKEMARLYRAALRRQVQLSVVLDSCHSGGMARGSWNAGGKNRSVPPDPRTVNDPPEKDPVTGKKLQDPAEMGMLFLAAARKDQPAGETTIVDRGTNRDIAHGAFTAALAKVLQSPVANQSVEQICERVQAMLAAEGRTQVPICGGTERKSRGLVGQEVGGVSAITLSAEGLTAQGLVRLRGGSALGLAPGCTLSRISGKPVQLELVRVELAFSEGKPVGGTQAGAVQTGDLFKLETWTAPPDSALRVYFDREGVEANDLLKVAHEIEQLNGKGAIEVLTRPGREQPPTHVLFWMRGSYFLERYPHAGDTKNLGPLPTGEQIRRALADVSTVRLWVILPPTRQLLAELKLGAGTQNAGVQVVNEASQGVYFLAGQMRNGQPEYCWLLKDVLTVNTDQARLPVRTDYKTSGTQLTELATRLAKVYAWLNMNGPVGGDAAFPYRLVFEKEGTRQPAGGGPFRFGEKYKVVFEAAPEALKKATEAGGVAKRYVYVFLIDSLGQATCFFPVSANGNDQNLLPRGEPQPRIPATSEDYDVEISAPAGTDNYFMIASEQPLDPGVFEWGGVNQDKARGGPVRTPTALDLLFASVGHGTRGLTVRHSVPVNWSIQTMAIRSVAGH